MCITHSTHNKHCSYIRMYIHTYMYGLLCISGVPDMVIFPVLEHSSILFVPIVEFKEKEEERRGET